MSKTFKIIFIFSVESKENETNSESEEKVNVLLIEKTVVLEDENEDNKTQNLIIENSDVKINVISLERNNEDEKIDEDQTSFWQNGFTIGLHVSPLAMCLFTALILTILLMRLALKIHKKHLEKSMTGSNQPTSSGGKRKHEFDNVSLDTVTTN